MKKNIYLFLFLGFSLAACSKADDHFAVPQQQTAVVEHTILSGFTGYAQGNVVQLSFTYTGDVSQVSAFRIYSGVDSHQLCAIGEIQISDMSKATFSFTDNHPKGDPTYYLVGIVDRQGRITYANQILSVSLKSNNAHS
ncbi:MAG: hypothetical protein K6T34_08625 [Thermoflavifilum sp.]|nr:hypothetical protein [Thermoflavifilum sp.]